MEFSAKLNADSFPFNEYDFTDHPDDFLNYINSAEMQIFLLEKEMLNTSSNGEMIVIQDKIQQLFRNKYSNK